MTMPNGPARCLASSASHSALFMVLGIGGNTYAPVGTLESLKTWTTAASLGKSPIVALCHGRTIHDAQLHTKITAAPHSAPSRMRIMKCLLEEVSSNSSPCVLTGRGRVRVLLC